MEAESVDIGIESVKGEAEAAVVDEGTGHSVALGIRSGAMTEGAGACETTTGAGSAGGGRSETGDDRGDEI